ncbi:conjugal transfer protein [Streptomyces sp. NPDC056632]|uniref:conjugal transfer protein n=1 Tax=Streptomyces sp. NPDC056632 TaxID=3345884 RepID=UPI00368D1C64
MVAVGAGGGLATFTNVTIEFGRAETAIGAVAAGEGVTLVLALVMVGLTMLGQAAPTPVRLGHWLAPAAASVIGLAFADNATEAVVYAITPMGMSGAAEGLGLVARRIVVYRTRTDAEVARRNADAARALTYHLARAARHPGRIARWRSERATWRIARIIGAGDAELSDELLSVQRTRVTHGADTAHRTMMGTPTPAPAPEPKAPHRAGTMPGRSCGAASPRWTTKTPSPSSVMRTLMRNPRSSPPSSSNTASWWTPSTSSSSQAEPRPPSTWTATMRPIPTMMRMMRSRPDHFQPRPRRRRS